MTSDVTSGVTDGVDRGVVDDRDAGGPRAPAQPGVDEPPPWWHRLLRRPAVAACVGLVTLYLLIAVAGFAGLLPDHQAIVGPSQQPPAGDRVALWFGTDLLGRSIVWRVLAGAQTAVVIGFGTVAVALPVGVLLGLLAGWYGGWVDDVVNWLYAVVTSIPGILLVMAVAYALGRGLLAMVLALAVTEWVGAMRLVRGEVLKQRGLDYVQAARLAGASPWQIITGEIAPNVMHVPVIWSSLVMLAAVKAEVVLTFIGIGMQDGASWGLLIAGAAQDLVNGIWWPLTAAVVAMFGLVFSLSVIADALRDVMEPPGR